MENQNRLTDVAAHALLDRLFPLGVAGPDVLAELAPAGWDQSPLLACFHPSADQRREESRQFERNLLRLRALMSRRTGTEGAEIAELIGMCLWDVFSDNHEVVTADGRVADIGSFRGASAFDHFHRLYLVDLGRRQETRRAGRGERPRERSRDGSASAHDRDRLSVGFRTQSARLAADVMLRETMRRGAPRKSKSPWASSEAARGHEPVAELGWLAGAA